MDTSIRGALPRSVLLLCVYIFFFFNGLFLAYCDIGHPTRGLDISVTFLSFPSHHRLFRMSVLETGPRYRWPFSTAWSCRRYLGTHAPHGQVVGVGNVPVM